jgi:mono/diheme cytochrome c family protein
LIFEETGVATNRKKTMKACGVSETGYKNREFFKYKKFPLRGTLKKCVGFVLFTGLEGGFLCVIKQISTAMKSKRLASILALPTAFLLLVAASPFKQQTKQPPVAGESLYKKHCKQCHGTDGTKGFFGAKNLKVSSLAEPAIIRQVQEGKGWMPSFKKKFSPEELTLLADYVKSLRQN